MPLVAPTAAKSVKASVTPPIAADELPVPDEVILLAPVPPIFLPFLEYAPPNLVPNACSKVESAYTINASIKTCLVLTSISLITLSTTSKSFSFPLTIMDLVVVSSVI